MVMTTGTEGGAGGLLSCVISYHRVVLLFCVDLYIYSRD